MAQAYRFKHVQDSEIALKHWKELNSWKITKISLPLKSNLKR